MRKLKLTLCLLVAVALGCGDAPESETPAQKPLEINLSIKTGVPEEDSKIIEVCGPLIDSEPLFLIDTSRLVEPKETFDFNPIEEPLSPDAFGPWRSQFLDEIPIFAELSCHDVAQIVALIRNTPGIDRRILYIYKSEAGDIEVQTGEVCGYLDGDGNSIIVRKEAGEWKITGLGWWVS